LGNRWNAAIVIALLSLGLVACGGGSDAVPGGGLAPSSPEIVACLKRGGATAEPLDTHSDLGEVVGGQAVNGDVIFIITLTSRKMSDLAIEAVRKKKKEAGVGGIMTSSTVDDGYAVVGVVGHEGVNGGVPSSASEELARACASRPRT
jgi:hypothetical protein